VKVPALLGAAMITIIVAAPAGAATYMGVAKTPSVVWVTDTPPPLPAAEPEMHQSMKSFVPGLVIVPLGGSVRFPNDDPFYHSVYSDSPGNEFDLGLYDTGPGKSVHFDTPGIVDIHCHVHGTMHATVIVVDGPYAQTQAPDEHYRIDGLSPGRHVLHVWSGGVVAPTTTIVVK